MARLRSLDVFRGLTVAAMVFVNSPGSDHVYAPLRHSQWNGLTPTDLIFPAFLVILGVSSAYSRRNVRQALLRAAVLLGLGLLENFFVFDGAGGVRFPGVLQRIALCYLGLEAFLLLDRPKWEPLAAAGLLLLYALLLGSVFTPEGNLAYRLDRIVFGGHLLRDRWGDPEGLLPTLSSLATSLFGLVAGRILKRDGASAAGRLAAAGLGLAALGAVWSHWLPLNKHLWTSSYAVCTGGLSLTGLAACLMLVEGRAARWSAPFEALGRRALAVYVLAGFVYSLEEFIKLRLPSGSPGNLKLWVTAQAFEPWLSAKSASLAFAASYTAATAAAALFVAKRFDRR
jgi:predicted acyltransferase